MRANIAKICAVILGLVLCAAAQDMSPMLLGAKPPFLLAFSCFAGIPAAICAGLFADVLSGLPFGCSAVFCAIAALCARLSKSMSIAITIFAAAIYQLWIAVWSGNGGAMQSIAGALVTAALISPLMSETIQLARRRIGIDATKEATI